MGVTALGSIPGKEPVKSFPRTGPVVSLEESSRFVVLCFEVESLQVNLGKSLGLVPFVILTAPIT